MNNKNTAMARFKFHSVLALGLLLVSLVIASCTIQGGTGSLSISTSSRNLQTSGDYVRIQLLNNGKSVLLQAPDKYVLERDLSTDSTASQTIDGLSPGPGYQLILVTGSKNSNGKFLVAHYGITETFSISSGTNTAQGLVLKANPFQTLTQSTNGSTAVVGDTLWYVDSDKLVSRNDSDTVSQLNLDSNFTGKTVQGLSTGKRFDTTPGTTIDELWVNTSKGIVPYNGTSFVPNFMEAGLEPSVTNSTAVFFDGVAPESLVYLFKGKGLVLGGASESDYNKATSDWDWSDLDTMRDNPDFADFDSLIGSMTKDVLTTFAVSDTFVYLATPLTTVLLNQALQDDAEAEKAANPGDLSADWIADNILNNPEYAVRILDDLGQEQVITAISTAGNLTFASTARGLYSTQIDADGSPASGSGYTAVSSVPATAYANLASVSYGGFVYTAAISAKGDLYLLKEETLLSQFPSFSGLPGSSLSITFWSNDDGLWVVISGSDGVVRKKIAPAIIS